MDFFINEFIDVTQGATIYSKEPSDTANQAEYDYIFNVNVASSASLFNVATYVQNSDNANLYDATLTSNASLLMSVLNASATSVGQSRGENTTFDGDDKTVGLRFLELVAVKVFGHAKARAAIANDNDFTTDTLATSGVMSQITTGIMSKVNQELANKVFEVYAGLDKIETANQDDITAPINFNLSGSTWEFPIHFTSSLTAAAGGTLTAVLNNGPADGNGVVLSSGVMTDVPILLRLVVA